MVSEPGRQARCRSKPRTGPISRIKSCERPLTDAGYDIKSIERTDTPVAAIRERLKSSAKVITGGRESLGAAVAALLASSTTLVCCVLPAVMVSIGGWRCQSLD